MDWIGSLLVTASLMSGIYAIVEATAHGWISSQVLGFGGLAAALMAAFLVLEARIENPIMPLRILRLRGLVNASLVRGHFQPQRSESRSRRQRAQPVLFTLHHSL